jgi:DNA-binding HxlR family transcriptional regulator
MAKAKISNDACPMALGINILSGRWKLQIVWIIHRRGIIRFNELQKLLSAITTKTLTQQLKELEEEEIVKRTVYPEVHQK